MTGSLFSEYEGKSEIILDNQQLTQYNLESLSNIEEISKTINQIENEEDVINALINEIESIKKNTLPCLKYDKKQKEMKIAKEGDCKMIKEKGVEPDEEFCFYKVQEGDYKPALEGQCYFFI